MRKFVMIQLLITSSVYCCDKKVSFVDHVTADKSVAEVDAIELEYNKLKQEWAKLEADREGALEKIVFAYMRLIQLRRKLVLAEQQVGKEPETELGVQLRGIADLQREQKEGRDKKEQRKQRELLANAREYDCIDRLRKKRQKLLDDMDRTIKSCNLVLRKFRYVKEQKPRS